MKALIPLILSLTTMVVLAAPPLLAQTPAPKTGDDADRQAIALMAQKQQLEIELRNDPNFLKWESMQQDIDHMKQTALSLHQQEAQARQAAARKAKEAGKPKP